MLKRFLFYLFLLSAPLVLMVVLNIILDSRSYYNDRYATSLAIDLSENDLSIFREPSLRIVKRELISENSGRHFDKIILGSSRTMHLGSNNPNILNISVPGAVFEDYEILLNLLDSNSIRFDTIVISAHPWLFNINHGDVRYKTFNSSFLLDSLQYAFSWKYFWDNVTPGKYELWDGNDKDFVIYKNGTVRFDKSYREDIPDISHYVENAMNGAFNDFNSINENYRLGFEKMIKELVVSGHIVELILLPYHPFVYNELITKVPVVTEIEKLYYSYRIENVNVWGSYDPFKLNLESTDFYDANHMRWESLENLYSSGRK